MHLLQNSTSAFGQCLGQPYLLIIKRGYQCVCWSIYTPVLYRGGTGSGEGQEVGRVKPINDASQPDELCVLAN